MTLFEVPAPPCRHGREPAACPFCHSPPRARSGDPDTSHEAARSAAPAAGSIRANVLEVLRDSKPLTDEELVASFRRRGLAGTPSGIRTRRSELVAQGRVVRYPIDGETAAGRRSARWTPSGEVGLRVVLDE